VRVGHRRFAPGPRDKRQWEKITVGTKFFQWQIANQPRSLNNQMEKNTRWYQIVPLETAEPTNGLTTQWKKVPIGTKFFRWKNFEPTKVLVTTQWKNFPVVVCFPTESRKPTMVVEKPKEKKHPLVPNFSNG
jgi:hypothetical protein